MDFVFITERRCGAGGKTEVAQNLLHSLDLKDRACLFDDNLEVAEEILRGRRNSLSRQKA